MRKAKISEVFTSIQGEGIYLGLPQLFVRFYGCNLSCDFCDTKPSSYETLTPDDLCVKMSEQREPYHSVSFTGGEPLLQAGFIKNFLRQYGSFYKKPVYLETNGTLHRQLSGIIDYVDTIAMDIKLPSSTGSGSLWKKHERFLKVAKNKKIFIKAVITSETTTEDVMRLAQLIKKAKMDISVVLQPVTPPEGGIKPLPLPAGKFTSPPGGEVVLKAKPERLKYFRRMLKKQARRVEIIPQFHKLMGIK